MKQLSWVLLLLLLAGVPTPLRAEGVGWETLKGLSGVYVGVENLRPEAEQAGLHKDDLVTDAELRLRTAGIKVFTERESDSAPGSPALYVNVNAIPGRTGFIFSINLELKQACLLNREESHKLLHVIRRRPPTIELPGEGRYFLL